MAILSNLEYLKAALNRFNLTDSDINLIMAEHPELTGALNVPACKLAIYDSMSAILPMANISECGYSVSWNIDGLKLWYALLCNEIGKTNALKPTIRNRSNYW